MTYFFLDASALIKRYISEVGSCLVDRLLEDVDALLLQAAMDYTTLLQNDGHDLVFVSSDQRLLKAAQKEGLSTFDPVQNTSVDLSILL